MLAIDVRGADGVAADLDALPAALRQALLGELAELSAALVARVQAKLSGESLAVRSGRLRDSVVADTGESASGLFARLVVAGVPYAVIHEFGGTTAAHEIAARKAQALHFVSGGKGVFARRVDHPGSRMPERSYLRVALAEMEGEILSRAHAAVADAAANIGR